MSITRKQFEYPVILNNPKAIRICSHFKIHDHNSTRHSEFTIIEKLRKISNVSKVFLWLKRREDFWIIKLQTLQALKGLYQELNNF